MVAKLTSENLQFNEKPVAGDKDSHYIAKENELNINLSCIEGAKYIKNIGIKKKNSNIIIEDILPHFQ